MNARSVVAVSSRESGSPLMLPANLSLNVSLPLREFHDTTRDVVGPDAGGCEKRFRRVLPVRPLLPGRPPA